MMKRPTRSALGVGLLAGGVVGFAVGRRTVSERPAPQAPEAAPPVVVVAPPAAVGDRAHAVQYTWNVIGQESTVPTRVVKGLTRRQAAAVLRSEGFEPAPAPVAAAGVVAAWPTHAWNFRRPWEGGYHFVTVEFTDDHVSAVFELWNDP